MKTPEEKHTLKMLSIDPPRHATRGRLEPAGSMRDLKAEDLCRGTGSQLPELIVAKLHTLNPTGFTERRVARKARLLLDLLRDTLSRRWPHLSLAAFAEILVAMHYFIKVNDEIPDTYDGGYIDDLRRLNAVCEDHRLEIEDYLRWRGAR